MSVMLEILLNIESKETRCAVMRHGMLQDLVVERRRTRQVVGNIYRGDVANVLQNIQSAFIDIGEKEAGNGFIHISDILENQKKYEKLYDMDFERQPEEEENQTIEQMLHPDQTVLVQVLKEPIGSKGARLTSKASIPGRYLVLLPNSVHRGVSRKIEDRSVRDRLKRVLRALEIPQGMGVICRTASCHATPEMVADELAELLGTWKDVMSRFQKATGPQLLYEESDLIKRMLLQAIDKRFDRILVDDYSTFQRLKRLYKPYVDEHPLRIELYRDRSPMFERFNVEREIDKALRHKIWLSGGGYLIFDQTEAMVTIDVNSGRSSGRDRGDLEESIVQVNLDAAEEIGRQLKIRNIGGLIICDFIDMRLNKNGRRILERLRECMKGDSARCTILGMSEFGLVEMTRQRSRESLAQTLCASCPYCDGRGLIKSHETVAIEIERALQKIVKGQQEFALGLRIHPALERHLEDEDRQHLAEVAGKENARLEIITDDTLHLTDYHFFSTISDKKIEV